jgi:homoserine acetyltransferase
MPMRARLLQLRAGAARPSALLQPTAALSTAAAAPLERSSSIKVKDLQGRARPAGKRVTRLDGPFELDYGGSLPHVDVAWEQWGDPSLPASRTVYILPSFSNSSHVVRSLNDPSPGWWEGMVGPGLYIDTNRFRVLSASNLGGPFGTTSPISEDPTTGKPYRLNFPQITPGDVARVHHRLMQQVRGLARLIPELWAVSPLWKALPNARDACS